MSPPTYAPRDGEDGRARVGVQGQPELRRGHVRIGLRRGDEGRHSQRLGIDPERELRHRRVAGERHLVDLAGVDLALLADLLGELLQGLAREVAQALERGRIEHRGRDARDHVGAEGLLAVQPRAYGERRAGGEIEQRRDDGCRSEVERDRVAAIGRVARLDVDEEVVHDDARDAEVRLAQDARQAAENADLDAEVEVVDRVPKPVEVGSLIRERRLLELDVALLERRPQDYLAPDAHGRGLRPGDERRHVQDEVGLGVRAAGEPPAVGEPVLVEGAQVELGDRDRSVGDPHLALLAGAVPAAGRVDRDSVPRGRVEHGHAGRNAHGRARRLEAQRHPGRLVGRAVALLGRVHRDRHAVAACTCACACAAACAWRWAAIQSVPHSSRPRRRSAARHASTV